MLAVHLNIGDVVLEHGWDIDLSVLHVSTHTRNRCGIVWWWFVRLSARMTRRRGIRGEDSGTNLWECALGEDAGVQLAYTAGKRWSRVVRHSHEQAGLAACTVTNNDQLATDLRHLR